MSLPHALAPYRSPEALAVELDRVALRLGAERVEYGRSAAGAPLVALRVPGSRPGLPRVLCCANIHGPELVSTEVALGVLRALDQGGARSLRTTAEVWVAPSLNPDGHRRTFELSGNAALAQLRPNERGVDLNRNYPLPGGRSRRTYGLPGAGSTHAGDATYIGPCPLSEPETAAIDALTRAQRFVASANLHSFMGTVIPARVTDRSSYHAYRTLCGTLIQAQPVHHYRRIAHRLLDVYTGEQEDHQHHNLGCWSVCVETFSVVASYRQYWRAPSTFWRFNPIDPKPWVDNDVPGIMAFFAAALCIDPPPPAATSDSASSRTDP